MSPAPHARTVPPATAASATAAPAGASDPADGTGATGSAAPGTAGRAGSGPRLSAQGVSLGYGERVVVGGDGGLDLDVPDGAVTSIIGPNGCGKSTLLRALGRLLTPASGQVVLDGRRIDRLPTRQVATALGLLPQSPVAPEGLTVRDLVARGRHPHQRWFAQWSPADAEAVAEALAQTGLLALADRAVDQLSGGQRQRAWISMALAQGTELLLLDEPTTFLDLAHQVEVLDLVHQLNTDRGRTVVMVLHDLNLAARYSDHVVAMCEGRIVAQGPPREVVTEELLAEVFGLDARVLVDPVSGGPLVVPVGARHRPAAPRPGATRTGATR